MLERPWNGNFQSVACARAESTCYVVRTTDNADIWERVTPEAGSEMTIATGSKLGPYEIVGQIGAGGMGEVYRAKDPRLGREVAIKVLPASFSQDADRLRRFEQEAKAAGVLNHPNITAVYDIGQPRRCALRRPGAARGRDAARGARRRPLLAAQGDRVLAPDRPRPRRRARQGHRPPRPEARERLRHRRQPGQDPRLRPRQADAAGESARSARRICRPDHCGHRARRRAGHARLHVARAGRAASPPTRAATSSPSARSSTRCSRARARSTATPPRDTMSAILKEDPPDLSVTNQNISPGLERVVRHCLEKNPELRFQSARDLAFDLEALSGTSAQSLAARGTTRPLRTPAMARARRPRGDRRGVRGRPAALEAGGRCPSRPTSASRSGAATSATRASRRTPRRSSTAPPGRALRSRSIRRGRAAPSRRRSGTGARRSCAVSSTGELLLSLREAFLSGSNGVGTLARAPLGGGSPREILEFVEWADWSPNGKDIAIIRFAEGTNRLEFPIGKVLYANPRSLFGLRFSPQGDRIAFLERGGIAPRLRSRRKSDEARGGPARNLSGLGAFRKGDLARRPQRRRRGPAARRRSRRERPASSRARPGGSSLTT